VSDRLYRSRDDRMLAGVAAGVADSLDADPSLIRIIWAILVLPTGFIALLVYVVMAIVVPERPAGMPVRSRTQPWTPTQDADAPVPDGGWRAPDGSTVPLAGAAPTTDRPPRDPADRTRLGFVLGLALIGVGAIFLLRQLVPAFDFDLLWPLAAIGAGVLLVVVALLPSRRSD
jgi:phage shock protein PspC (stress-responsive transcriptional regulator)